MPGLALHQVTAASLPSGDTLNCSLAVWDMLLCKFPFFGLILILQQLQAVPVTSGPKWKSPG